MTTVNIVPVFDTRDKTMKFMTLTMSKRKYDIKFYKSTTQGCQYEYKSLLQDISQEIGDENIVTSINDIGLSFIPRINDRGNVILEMTPKEFFSFRFSLPSKLKEF